MVSKEQVMELLSKTELRISFKLLVEEFKVTEKEEIQELFKLLEILEKEKILTIRYIILCYECSCELLSRKKLTESLLGKEIYCIHCREINSLHPQLNDILTMIYPNFEQLKMESVSKA